MVNMGSISYLSQEALPPTLTLEKSDKYTGSSLNSSWVQSKEYRNLEAELAKAKDTIQKQCSRLNTLQLQITGQALEISKLKKQESEQRTQLTAQGEAKKNLNEQLKKCQDILIQYENTMKLQREKVQDNGTQVKMLHAAVLAKEMEIETLKKMMESCKEKLVESEGVVARRDGQLKWHVQTEREWEEKVKRLEEDLGKKKATLAEQKKSTEETDTWSKVLKDTVFKQKTEITKLKNTLEKHEQTNQVIVKTLGLFTECLEKNEFSEVEKMFGPISGGKSVEGMLENKIKRVLVLTRDRILEEKKMSEERLKEYRKKIQGGLAFLTLMAGEEVEEGIGNNLQVLPSDPGKIHAEGLQHHIQKKEIVKVVNSIGYPQQMETLAKLEKVSSNEEEEFALPLTAPIIPSQVTKKNGKVVVVDSKTQCKRCQKEFSQRNLFLTHRFQCGRNKWRKRRSTIPPQTISQGDEHPQTGIVKEDNKPLDVERSPKKIKKVRFCLPDRVQRHSRRGHLNRTLTIPLVAVELFTQQRQQQKNEIKTKQNVSTVHRQISATKCLCKRNFQRPANLQQHLRFHQKLSSGPLSCSRCDQKFCSEPYLVRHQNRFGHHLPPTKIETPVDTLKSEPDDEASAVQDDDDDDVETISEEETKPITVQSPITPTFSIKVPPLLSPVVLLERMEVVEVGEVDVAQGTLSDKEIITKFPCWCCSLSFATQTERIIHHKSEHRDEI